MMTLCRSLVLTALCVLALSGSLSAARLVTSGFDLNSLTLEAAFQNLTGTPTASTTVKRTGDYSQIFSAAGAGTEKSISFRFINTAGSGPYYARTYLYVDTLPPNLCGLMRLGSGGTTHGGGVGLNSDGTLALYDEDGLIGTSASALSTDQWYRIEIEFDGTGAGSTDIVKLYVDGTAVVSSTSRNVASTINELYVGGNIALASGNVGQLQTTGIWYLDDLAINDNTGANQTGLPGAGSVQYLRPNGAGDADEGTPLRGGTDSGSDHGQLDEVTPNDATDYMVLDVNPGSVWVDSEDGSTKGIGASDTINLVEVNARVTAASGTASNWFPQIKKTSGGTIASASAVTWASATWFTNDDTSGTQQSKLVRYTDPDGGNWTPSTVDSMQLSAKTTDGNPDTWVSAIWGIVEYVPNAGGTAVKDIIGGFGIVPFPR